MCNRIVTLCPWLFRGIIVILQLKSRRHGAAPYMKVRVAMP